MGELARECGAASARRMHTRCSPEGRAEVEPQVIWQPDPRRTPQERCTYRLAVVQRRQFAEARHSREVRSDIARLRSVRPASRRLPAAQIARRYRRGRAAIRRYTAFL